MAVEALWTTRELNNISGGLANLEEFLQGWEQDYEVKISGLLINLDSDDVKNPVRVGLIGLHNKADTLLQFEAIDAEIGPA